MRNLILKHSLKKQDLLATFLFVCSLFMCEKALAAGWGTKCCEFYQDPQQTKVKIDVKFFEYDMYNSRKNSFLNNFRIKYSTDGAKTYTFLMLTSTTNQYVAKAKNWSWIRLEDKKKGENIDLLYQPFDQAEQTSIPWRDNFVSCKLNVKNHPTFKNQTWLSIVWSHKLNIERKENVTHIQITGTWYEHGVKSNPVVITHVLGPKKSMLNSNSLNFSNTSVIHEIKTESNNDIVNVCNEANTLVVKGAPGEKIQLYTTTGKLVKSIVTDCDLFQIPLPKNQHYIVKVGQISYKIAL